MKVALIPPASSPVSSFRHKVVLSPSTRHLVHHSLSLLSESCRRRFSIGYSIKAPAAENFSEEPKKVTSYIKGLVDYLWERSPGPVKKFPWKEARSMAIERLLILGHKAFKFSLIALFAISSALDVTTAISLNRELMIPLGLFIGVALADFVKESLQDFYQSMIKDENNATQLWGVGLFFVLLKLITLCFNIQGRLLLSLTGDGGLMQVLWLMKEMQQTQTADGRESVPQTPMSTYPDD